MAKESPPQGGMARIGAMLASNTRNPVPPKKKKKPAPPMEANTQGG